MSQLQHILDCIYRFRADFGADPSRISITEDALRTLRREIASDPLAGMTQNKRLVFLRGLLGRDEPLNLAGVPLEVIPENRQRELLQV